METLPSGRTKELEPIDYEARFCSLYGEPIYRSFSSANIRFKCPSCGGLNSFYCNVENGLYHCFKCSYGKGQKPVSGKVIQVNPQSKIDTVLHMKVSKAICEICSLSDLHREYLKSRGIYRPEQYGIVTAVPFLDNYLLKLFSLKELIDSGYVKISNGKIRIHSAVAWNKILIPFWDGNTIITLKSRVNPYDVDENQITYITAPGGKIAKKVWNHGVIGTDLIITEGELKAICALEHGLSCVAIPGIAMSVNSLGAIRRIIYLNKIKRIFIIFDTDPTKKVRDIVDKYTDYLNKHIPNSRVVILPSTYRNEKIDLDLFLYRYGVRELLTLMDNAWVTGSNV